MAKTRTPTAPEKEDERKEVTNIVLHLNALQYAKSTDFTFHGQQIRKSLVKAYLPRFEPFDLSSFAHRVTSISWNQNEKEVYTVGAGDKYGNFLVLRGSAADGNTRNFSPVFQKDGIGVGDTITGIKFQTNEDVILTGILGQVLKINMTTKQEQVFHDFQDYMRWFTSLDLSNKSGTVIAGDTNGFCHLFSTRGESIAMERVHKSKVLHCEYNPMMPHLLATAGLDRKVKLFDLRKFKADNCLEIFEHKLGCNVARFSPQNGSRLLINDQNDEISIYQGPLWHHSRTISHPHRQFQHITPIKASWHPLSEAIIIGTFPQDKEAIRTVHFYDPDTGALIYEARTPKNLIMSLNEASPLGDILASSAARSLILWDARKKDAELELIKSQSLSVPLTSELQAVLRGEQPSSSRGRKRRRGNDDDEDDANPANRRRTGTGGTHSKKTKAKSAKKAP